ncbi:DUF664 domain-containing protein [Streptomyces sp. NPDC015414]|uniref:mycothiol transferase n=1 Tax=Streptomyces sp. NPDC015414 TaxID=3364957 RepID=UPI0036FA2A68
MAHSADTGPPRLHYCPRPCADPCTPPPIAWQHRPPPTARASHRAHRAARRSLAARGERTSPPGRGHRRAVHRRLPPATRHRTPLRLRRRQGDARPARPSPLHRRLRRLPCTALGGHLPAGRGLLTRLLFGEDVERGWFCRVFFGVQVSAVYVRGSACVVRLVVSSWPGGVVLCWALVSWDRQFACAREVCAGRVLADTGRFMVWDVELCWFCVDVIGEFACHSGRADLLRERFDGAGGVWGWAGCVVTRRSGAVSGGAWLSLWPGGGAGVWDR